MTTRSFTNFSKIITTNTTFNQSLNVSFSCRHYFLFRFKCNRIGNEREKKELFAYKDTLDIFFSFCLCQFTFSFFNKMNDFKIRNCMTWLQCVIQYYSRLQIIVNRFYFLSEISSKFMHVCQWLSLKESNDHFEILLNICVHF